MPCCEGFDHSAEVLVTQVTLFLSVKAQKPEADYASLYYTIKQLPFRENSPETKDSGTVHDCVVHCDSLRFNLRVLSWEITSHVQMHLGNSLRTCGLTARGLSVTKMHPMRMNKLHGARHFNQSSIQDKCKQMHPVFESINYN